MSKVNDKITVVTTSDVSEILSGILGNKRIIKFDEEAEYVEVKSGDIVLWRDTNVDDAKLYLFRVKKDTKIDIMDIYRTAKLDYNYNKPEFDATEEDEAIPEIYKDYVTVYTLTIDEDIEDPYMSVSYGGAARNAVPGWAYWSSDRLFKNIRPCVIDRSANEVKCYLQKDNRGLKEDGTPLGELGPNEEVVIEFGDKIGYKFERNGSVVKIKIALFDSSVDLNYDAYGYKFANSHVYGEKLYIGAYFANKNKDYRSVPESRVSDIEGINYTDFETYYSDDSRRNMGGYHLGVHTLLQCLYLLIFKNLSSQSEFSVGLGNSIITKTTGYLNDRFFVHGTLNGANSKELVFLGLEDWYNSRYYWLHGDGDANKMTPKGIYNSRGESDPNKLTPPATGITITKIDGGDKFQGFLPTAGATTDPNTPKHYVDLFHCSTIGERFVVGNRSDVLNSGVFSLRTYADDVKKMCARSIFIGNYKYVADTSNGEIISEKEETTAEVSKIKIPNDALELLELGTATATNNKLTLDKLIKGIDNR